MEEDATTFAKALSGASSYHWTGAGKGYLATITGANEQAFIYHYIRSTISNVSSIMYWFIGSQKTSPNATNWFWINGFPPSLPPLSLVTFTLHTKKGPEEGIVFYTQTFRNLTYHCCCLTYCAWGYRPGLGPEPNGEGGIEDSLSLILNDGTKPFLTHHRPDNLLWGIKQAIIHLSHGMMMLTISWSKAI